MNSLKKRMRYLLVKKLGSKIIPSLPAFLLRVPLPSYVIIEATNMCNLRCPLCPTNTSMTRKKGMMTMNDYRRLVKELSGFVKMIAFNFSGEPTLHPQLFAMVKEAEEKNIKTYISTNTTLVDKHLPEVFSSGLSAITVCLDGANKKNHEAYRVGSDFAKVKKNISVLVREKHRRQASKPHIELQFLVMKHNEGDIPKMLTLAKSLGVDKLSLKTISLGSSISLQEKIRRSRRYLPLNQQFSRYETAAGELRVKNQPIMCDWPFRRSVIYFNGDVTTCCYDFNGDHTIGNVFECGSFKKLWFSYAYAKTRKAVLKHHLPLCRTCTLPTDYGVVLNRRQL